MWFDTVRGALSGALGDYLHETGNPLAIAMELVEKGEPLACGKDALTTAFPRASDHVVVFVHGLSCTESVWSFPKSGETYGSRLSEALGVTSIHVRYNSGRRISDNGEALSGLLDRLVASFPVPIRTLDLVGHSMGGLVMRSAFSKEAAWLPLVRHAFYIGCPHTGAPLEQAANAVGRILRLVGRPETEALAQAFELRSAGIKDLRHGNLVREDWHGHDPHAFESVRGHVPLPSHVRHHLFVGMLGNDEQHLASLLFGDLMVRLPSGRGEAKGALGPAFPTEFVQTFPGVSHLTLAHHPRVYDALRAFMEAP